MESSCTANERYPKGDKEIANRKSEDIRKVCTCGNCLIYMCVASSCKMANCRVLGDPNGKFTCHKYNGSSVIDYVQPCAVRSKVFTCVFIGDISDHCLLSLGLRVSATLCETKSKQEGKQLPNRFKWPGRYQTLVQAILSADPLIKTLQQNKVVNVNAYSEVISNAISKAASKCMIKVGMRQKNKKK